MKLKVSVILLMIGIMLAGCGSEEKSTGDTGRFQESSNESTKERTEENTEESTEEAAPYILTFEATTTEGETITSDCLADSKLTMINVWATYCNPCLMEMPDLGEIAAEYDKSEFQILGIVSDVTTEDGQESVDYAKELIEETKADYPHLLLNESLYVNLVGGTSAVPTTFFVKQDGEVLGYVVGANTKEGWVELINQLLAEIE